MTLDELESHGLVRMDDGEIRGFLASQSTGVLGLPTGGAPYMVPMSYGFDGESLYFTYVLGTESRKAELTDGHGSARFLVYRADTAFNWQSVLLSGSVEVVSGAEREAVLESVSVGWRPEIFERAGEHEAVELRRFRVEDWSGVKHTGLPPGFEGTPPGADADSE